MFCKSLSGAVDGIEGKMVSVEADVRNGLPGFQMVGALAQESKEAKERVRVAIENSGFLLPPKRITINISPADLKKEGTYFDLPIAVSILGAFGFIPENSFKDYFLAGELSLAGEVLPCRGLLPMVCAAKKEGITKVVCAKDNLEEITKIPGIHCYGADNLVEIAEFFSGFEDRLKHIITEENKTIIIRKETDWGYFRREYLRPLMIAAAGHHSITFSGREYERENAVRSLFSLLPELCAEERLEICKMNSVRGVPFKDDDRKLIISDGTFANCSDELLDSHKGIFYLNNVNECDLKALRQIIGVYNNKKIECGVKKVFPDDFILCFGNKSCQCGYFPNRSKCSCSESRIKAWKKKTPNICEQMSDMFLEINPFEFDEIEERISDPQPYALKVEKALEIQAKRFGGRDMFNGQLKREHIDKFCRISSTCNEIIKPIFDKENFEPYAYFRLLKVSRTIADLEGREDIISTDIEEARSFCGLNRKAWKYE